MWRPPRWYGTSAPRPSTVLVCAASTRARFHAASQSTRHTSRRVSSGAKRFPFLSRSRSIVPAARVPALNTRGQLQPPSGGRSPRTGFRSASGSQLGGVNSQICIKPRREGGWKRGRTMRSRPRGALVRNVVAAGGEVSASFTSLAHTPQLKSLERTRAWPCTPPSRCCSPRCRHCRPSTQSRSFLPARHQLHCVPRKVCETHHSAGRAIVSGARRRAHRVPDPGGGTGFAASP